MVIGFGRAEQDLKDLTKHIPNPPVPVTHIAKKKYLVTGGAGFIGSNLVERLLKDGHEAIVIDNLSTGSIKNVPSGVPLFTGPYNTTLPRLPKIDGVFHLGAPSTTKFYRENKNLVAEATSDFIDILNFCNAKLRLVYVSSSSIYNGNPTPWVEDMQLIPSDFYAEARICWERLAQVYHLHYRTQSIGLRPFSVYGPKEEHKGTFANLVTQLKWAKEKGETFEVYGDGSQSRDLIHVSDVVEAFILSMNSSIEQAVFNVGTGKSFTLNEIAEFIGTRIKYVPNPLTGYVQDTLADTTKAEILLHFKAKTMLK